MGSAGKATISAKRRRAPRALAGVSGPAPGFLGARRLANPVVLWGSSPAGCSAGWTGPWTRAPASPAQGRAALNKTSGRRGNSDEREEASLLEEARL